MSSYPHFDPEERTAYYEESYERDLDALDVLEKLADEADDESLDAAQSRLEAFTTERILEGSV